MPPENDQPLLQQNGSLMLLNSEQLTSAARRLREADVPQTLLRNGVRVTPDQLEQAATILREVDPSIITSASGNVRGVSLGVPEERPGFIAADRQDAGDALVFEVGILPSKRYVIERDGRIDVQGQTQEAVVRQNESCRECPNCFGNGVSLWGSPCYDCEGTGCAAHPFCGVDHDNEGSFAAVVQSQSREHDRG